MTRPGEPKAWIDAAAQYVGEDCLLWPFTLRNGYGRVRDGGGQRGTAHRLVCAIVHGEPPSGKECAHSCGVRPCCNPRHLRWATHAENCADTVGHGTDSRGEHNGLSKLTESDVLAIRELAGTAPQRVIASRFSVSRENISLIINRKRWAHLEDGAA